MKRFFGVAILVLAFGLLTACKQDAKAMIYNDKSELITTIDDSAAVAEIVDAWKAKKRAPEKILPLFEYKIELDIDGETQVWRFNKAGYLMKENENTLYKTPQKDVLSKYVQ